MKIEFFKKKKAKIGLALGSGAARGLAHIGVIKALKEKNISIDMIAGSSIGALVGACYAKKGEISSFEEVILKIDWKQLTRLADPNLVLLFKGVIHGKKVKELLRALIGDAEFKDLKIPLAIVATDANTGEEVVIREGSVIEAVLASVSMPAIFTPVKFSAPARGWSASDRKSGSASGGENRFLIDGGIVNPVPVSVVKDMGATFIIASNVVHKPQRRRPLGSMKKQELPLPISKIQISAVDRSTLSRKNVALLSLDNKINKLVHSNKGKIQNFQKLANVFKKSIYKKSQRIDPDTPNIFDTISQAIYAMEYEIAKSKIKEADIVITPNTPHIAVLEFYRGGEAIAEGYKAAKNVISKSNFSK